MYNKGNKRQMQKSSPAPPRPLSQRLSSPNLNRPWLKWLLAGLLLLSVYIIPRGLWFQGLEEVHPLHFKQLSGHLTNLDRVSKYKRSHTFSGRELDVYFKQTPEMFRENPIGWPVGVYRVASIWAHRLGLLSLWTTQLTHAFFSIILAAGLLGLGAAMGSARAGGWAVLLTFLCPPLFGSTWFFNLDYPLTAMVAMGLLLLWHTRRFTHPCYCLAFGVWSGLGLLVKLTYPLYLLLPLLLVIAGGLACRGKRLRVLSNLLLSSLAVSLVYLPQQGMPPSLLWQHLLLFIKSGAASSGASSMIPPWTLEWFLAGPGLALMAYPGVLLALALPGLVMLHCRGRAPLPLRGALLGFFWGGYLLITLLDHKLERQLHPLYPMLCLVTAWSVLARVPRRWQTVALLWIAVSYAAVLSLMHERPAPWSAGSQSLIAQQGRYDLRLPSRAELNRLRRREQEPSCSKWPLERQLNILLQQEKYYWPAAVLFSQDMLNQCPVERLGGLRWRIQRAVLLIAQRLSHRHILLMDMERPLDTPGTGVVIHTPEAGVPIEGFRLNRRVRFYFCCDDGPKEMWASLYSSAP